jgi:hypothetical protein
VRSLLLLAGLATASVCVAAAAAGATGSQARGRLHGSNFFANCRFSHTAPDDPILHYGHLEPVTVTNRVPTYLELHVNFPDCWDGRRLDSPDHQSHMAHSREYVCPASHPVKVPLVRAMIRYPLSDGRDVALASGGQLTGHADFVNAWDQRAFERLVDDCFHDRPCNQPAGMRK